MIKQLSAERSQDGALKQKSPITVSYNIILHKFVILMRLNLIHFWHLLNLLNKVFLNTLFQLIQNNLHLPKVYIQYDLKNNGVLLHLKYLAS